MLLTAIISVVVAPRPHILFILQDDLGHYNVAFNANRTDEPSADVSHVSPHLTALAREGIILDRHYVHWHCSPSRRSFLTGRLPLHHGEELSSIASDDIDLRWRTIGQKLQSVGYESHWYGKGHTGYKSMNHLPVRLGFSAGHLGFLSGAMSYHGAARWMGEKPFHATTYSTDLYGEAAVAALQAYDPSKGKPLFMYLPWQAVHTPYTAPPDWNASAQRCDHYAKACIVYGMLSVADNYVGNLTRLLQQKQMWSSTLLIFSADNGGVTSGVNYPLRGEKHTNWDGGMRVAAFVSGGFIPPSLRGSVSKVIVHISDWYPTLARLAGADPTDDPPVPPLPIDPSEPHKDIYGERSFPPVDGVDVWPHLLDAGANETAAHESLWLSREVLLARGEAGRVHKLIVAQPSPEIMVSKSINNGWKVPNGTWMPSDEHVYGCEAYGKRDVFRPCIFELISDPREMTNLALGDPALLGRMWAQLNRTQLSEFHARTPAKLLGPCHPRCARRHWASLSADASGAEALGYDTSSYDAETWPNADLEIQANGAHIGPVCGVPGCAWPED